MVATQAQAPQLLPAERRLEQTRFLFEQFGINFNDMNRFLEVQRMNPGTPMEIDLRGRNVSPADVPREALIANSLIQNFGSERARGGIESFCRSEDDFYALVGAVFSSHAASTFGSISDGTNRWLFGLKTGDNGEQYVTVGDSRIASTLLQDMRGKQDWLMNNHEQFSSAAIFYIWATQNGFDADFVNRVGAAAFKELWIPAATVGQFLEYDNAQGSWILHGRERGRGWDRDTVGLAMDALRQLGPMSMAPSTFAEEQERAQERATFDADFRSRYQRGSLSISNTMHRVLTDGLGWGRTYSRVFRNYDMPNVEEGAVFYAWANRNPDLTEEQKAQIDSIGRERYGDNNWGLAVLLGRHLSPARGNASEYVLKTDDVSTFRADLDGFRMSQPVVRVAAGEAPAEAATVENATGLAQFAAQVGVSEEFMARAVELIRQHGTVNISFNRSDTAEAGMDEGTSRGVPWLRYHPPNGQTSFTNEQLLAAVGSAAESQGIRMRRA
ncbi:MAG: hypothetical protein PHQ80_02410 [Candidatus ainarchaeum sp.]|nr:hypothetical protein [Candidatus ainarchaeum sp.]MDD5096481.1 hypothetical protein [Candidatus ainarchaeum sp.]